MVPSEKPKASSDIKFEPKNQDEDGGINEIIIGKGIANALKLFKQRGMLGRDLNKGRTLDKTIV